ncbi:early endosome antigen 1-like [Adelges cooleyi]|uniref:early endosome antigen 1-like n=1 Tax=Adelges cooleyi TaxID=133065 RepID=UPI00217F91F8|nr:early endosome antigen 1-like [Adelges cooleyi]
MTENQENLKCQLAKAEERIRELEQMLCEFDNMKASRDCLEEKMSKADEWMDYVIRKQSESMLELISTHESARRELESHKELLSKSQRETDRLRCELDAVRCKFQKQEGVIKELEGARSDLKAQTCKLHKKIAELVESGKRMCDRLEEADRSLQKALADNKAERAEMDRKVEEAQAQNTCLRSAMAELKTEMESNVSKMQTELTGLRCQLSSKTANEAEAKCLLADRQQKLDAQAERMGRLKRMIEELRATRAQEKCKTDEEICELKAEVETVGKELIAVNKQYCDAHAEGEKLRCRADEQTKAIMRLESALTQQQQATKRAEQTAQMTAQKNAAERQQFVGELKQRDRKMHSMAQEMCELRRAAEERARQVKQLKKQLAEFKSPTDQESCDQQTDSFTSVLAKHAEVLTEEVESTQCSTGDSWYHTPVDDGGCDFNSTASNMKAHLTEFSETFNEMKTLMLTKFD